MPIYDYRCSSCESVWEEYKKMSDNKVPEGNPCPKCNATESVLQTIAYTAIPLSYTMEATNSMKKLNRSAFAEKLQQIHRETPGSNLHNSSTIVEIK